MADSLIERISLCRVSMTKDKDDKDTLRLIRLADVEDGILKEFHPSNGNKFFDNRDRLFWRNGPDVIGSFGIWKWSAVPNNKDYTKDYVISDYAEDLQAVEIIRVSSVTTIEKLSEIMTDGGLIIKPVSKRFLLCPQTVSSIKYRGLLCSVNNFSVEGGKFRLKDDVTNLPLYSFSPDDTINIDEKIFYMSLECGKPERMELVKNPLEIVRGIIRQRISWAKVKPVGIAKSTWQEIRAFITGMPADSVHQEVASACLCDEYEAKSYVDSFLSQAEKYIDDEDCEGIISAICENSPEIRGKIETAISENWHIAHQEKIDEADRKIEAVETELDAKKNELSLAEARLNDINKRIQAQEKLVQEVSVKVKQRISDARKDAASFIAEMSFINPNRESLSSPPVFYSPGINRTHDDTEYIHDWKDALDVLCYELIEAGVAQKYAQKFAAFLYSAYINRIPILMAGPNGEDIAEAFSVSLFGKTAGVADCSVSYFPGFEREITAGNDNVFIVKHVFRSEWITHIPDFQKLSGYCFIVHPFAEDLIIEPKSLFTYALPVFTELIADSPSKGNYIGAKRSESYKEYQHEKPGAIHDSLLRSFGFTVYTRYRVKAVLDDFHALSDSHDVDSDCLFALFPYAFLADRNRDSLLDRFPDISDGLRKELVAFIGENDE